MERRSPIIESILYQPNLKNSTDLEAATKTITAVAEGAVADYSSALTLPIPTDARLAIIRIGTRLAVTIDSMTATTLYCRVYVDAQDANHLLMDLSWGSTGAKLAAQDCLVGTLETIFNLLKDGSAHTFYFFFWVDAGNAVLSLVQLWEAVGVTGTLYRACLSLSHKGFYQIFGQKTLLGTGEGYMRWSTANPATGNITQLLLSGAEFSEARGAQVGISPSIMYLTFYSTVATDLTYVNGIGFILRSE